MARPVYEESWRVRRWYMCVMYRYHVYSHYIIICRYFCEWMYIYIYYINLYIHLYMFDFIVVNSFLLFFSEHMYARKHTHTYICIYIYTFA
jgi:hypothetical protein